MLADHTSCPPPAPEMIRMINASRGWAWGAGEIYYYNKITGTHILTCGEFSRLETLDDAALRRQVVKISRVVDENQPPRGAGNPPLRAADGFTVAAWSGPRFPQTLDDGRLREAYARLRQQFEAAVDPEIRRDDLANLEWRSHMYASLLGQADEAVSEETLLGLSSEFFMQVQWRPGGRIAEGELVFDPILDSKTPGTAIPKSGSARREMPGDHLQFRS